MVEARWNEKDRCANIEMKTSIDVTARCVYGVLRCAPVCIRDDITKMLHFWGFVVVNLCQTLAQPWHLRFSAAREPILMFGRTCYSCTEPWSPV